MFVTLLSRSICSLFFPVLSKYSILLMTTYFVHVYAWNHLVRLEFASYYGLEGLSRLKGGHPRRVLEEVSV